MTTTTITDSAPPGGVGGMLNTLGGRFGGYGLYLVKGIRKPNLMAVTLVADRPRCASTTSGLTRPLPVSARAKAQSMS